MRTLAPLAITALALLLTGCGGGASGPASNPNIKSAAPAILSISQYTLPPGSLLNQMYITAVDDNGGSYGSLGPALGGSQTPANPAAYWSKPTTYVTVPVLDSNVYTETLTGKSPLGAAFVGYTYDSDNSVGPSRGFAYYPASHQFHVLSISIVGATIERVCPSSVTDDGFVTGTVIFTSPSYWAEQAQQFVYNLRDDTFQLSVLPTQLFGSEYSLNDAYYGASINGNGVPKIYATATNALVSQDSADSNSFVDYISNDATVAVIEPISFGGSSDAAEQTKIWFPGRGVVNTYTLEQQLEPGVFNGTAMGAGSPLGHYITITNASEGGGLTRLVHVK